jgi:hypothetical protein
VMREDGHNQKHGEMGSVLVLGSPQFDEPDSKLGPIEANSNPDLVR